MTVIDEKRNEPVEKPADTPAPHEESRKKEKKNEMLSQENISSDTVVPPEEASSGAALSIGAELKKVTITPEDKISFINSVVNNTRFERSYSMFGGKLTFTVRSLTNEEISAISAYTLKKSVEDPAWHLSGRGRKLILVSQISKLNGTVIPPMSAPLFETVDKDGKTMEPGWVESLAFWDDKVSAVTDAVMKGISDFDIRYSTLCQKAEDENFWVPDTP